jgi:hypothetical protein
MQDGRFIAAKLDVTFVSVELVVFLLHSEFATCCVGCTIISQGSQQRFRPQNYRSRRPKIGPRHDYLNPEGAVLRSLRGGRSVQYEEHDVVKMVR